MRLSVSLNTQMTGPTVSIVVVCLQSLDNFYRFILNSLMKTYAGGDIREVIMTKLEDENSQIWLGYVEAKHFKSECI